MVHVSANLRKFLTIKSERDAMPTTKKTEPKTKTKKAMALPGEARTALIEGVMDALEKLTGVTQALKSATIDDNASVPDELPRMIKEASDGLLKVAGSYFSDEDADGDDTAKAAAEAAVIAATKKARRFTPKRRATIETATAALTELLAETADGAVWSAVSCMTLDSAMLAPKPERPVVACPKWHLPNASDPRFRPHLCVSQCLARS